MPQTLQHEGKWNYDPLAVSYKIGRSGLLASDIRNLRYPGTCANCGLALPARTREHWNHVSTVITCLAGAEHLGHADAVAESDPDPAVEPHPLTSIEPESGTPGASALYEFERRHRKREAAPVHKALCFVDAEWGLFSKPFQIDGVWITCNKHLAGIIAEPGPFSKDYVLTIANLLARTLRTAMEPQ